MPAKVRFSILKQGFMEEDEFAERFEALSSIEQDMQDWNKLHLIKLKIHRK